VCVCVWYVSSIENEEAINDWTYTQKSYFFKKINS